MPNTPVIIAIDLGTTGNRAIAFDQNGTPITSAYQEFPQYFPKPAWVEHNAEEILDSTLNVLDQVLTQVGPNNVHAIGITNQRETTVLWDKSTGKPIHNAIVWQCRRTAEACNELSDYKPLIKEKTGLFLDAYFSATKIKWLLENVSEAKPLLENNQLLFGTIDTWILWHLTGKQVHATDTSNASRTMLYNIHTLDWDQDLLELFQVPKSILPSVQNSNHHFGNTLPELTTRAIPITAILGDQQASLFAHAGTQEDNIKNTYGTGLFIVANTKDKRPKTETLINTIAWTIDGKTDYALEGSIFVGGSAIQWLRDGLELIQDASETETLARSIPSNEGVYFIPALTGLGAPHWKPNARGLIHGLTRGTTKAHIARATLEALAYQTRDVIETIKEISQQFLYTSLSVDGGAIHNTFLMQFQADQLQLPISIPTIADTTAFGVAGLAGISSSFWTEEHFRSLNPTTKIYTPNAMPAIDPYLKWKELIKIT